MLEKFKVFLLVVLTATVLAAVTVPKQTSQFGSFGDSFFTSATNTVVTLSNSSSTVALAKNSSRTYATFTNDDGSIVEYLALGGTATASSGIRLSTGQSYTINSTNLYVGDVSAIAASGSPKLLITYH